MIKWLFSLDKKKHNVFIIFQVYVYIMIKWKRWKKIVQQKQDTMMIASGQQATDKTNKMKQYD